MEYTTKEVWCHDGDTRIYGLAFLPEVEDGRRVPLVIFSHGFGTNHASGSTYGRHFAERGIAFYEFDFPGGSLGGNRSDGDPKDESVATEMQDLLAVVEQARQWDFVDPERIVLFGQSQGGCVSALVAGKHPGYVHALMLEYPALCIKHDAETRYPGLKDIPDTNAMFNGMVVGSRYYTDLRGLDIYGTIAGYDGPVLILHSNDDTIVDISYSERAAQEYAGHCRFHVMQGHGHGFTQDGDYRAMEVMDAWLPGEAGIDVPSLDR
ncbi:alpha/beta hydrolase family protein [Bifidobacterium cuniculi]|uniref:Feruloyl esterase n=1 Tax=Bifidobacterium cuniculi TaxID=1688 RepID=A0A087AX18_9BIFI|nr:alpha/beta fold hydrolase [Bifidobacterium cuniculi]KFI63318.1 feruloyl esterase [Bifidobacterium cuniculi]